MLEDSLASITTSQIGSPYLMTLDLSKNQLEKYLPTIQQSSLIVETKMMKVGEVDSREENENQNQHSHQRNPGTL